MPDVCQLELVVRQESSGESDITGEEAHPAGTWKSSHHPGTLEARLVWSESSKM